MKGLHFSLSTFCSFAAVQSDIAGGLDLDGCAPEPCEKLEVRAHDGHVEGGKKGLEQQGKLGRNTDHSRCEGPQWRVR